MPEVIVVGGGYFGSAISYKLSINGVKTILLEQGEIGSGASGANFGCVQVQDSELGLSLEMTLKGYESVKTMEKELGRDLGLRETGALVIAQSLQEMELIAKTAERKKEYGLKIDILDCDMLKKREPNLNTDGLAGATYSVQGQLNGFKYMYGMIAKGCRMGLEVREHAKVKALLMKNGICAGVELASGERLNADYIIISAGAWTRELCLQTGLEIPVEYVRAEASVTEKIEPFLQNYISFASFFTEAHGRDEAATSFCCAQTSSGNLLLGETSKPGSIPARLMSDLTSKEHCLGVKKAVQRYFPDLCHINIIRNWVTLSPYTESMLPVLGQTGIPGLIVAAGFKSAVVLSSIVGDVAADLVLHRKSSYDLSEFMAQTGRLL